MRHLQHKWSIWNSKYQQKNLLLIRTNKYANTFSFLAGRLGPKSNVEIVGPIFLADFLNASLTSRKVLKKNYFQRSGTFILEIWLTNNLRIFCKSVSNMKSIDLQVLGTSAFDWSWSRAQRSSKTDAVQRILFRDMPSKTIHLAFGDKTVGTQWSLINICLCLSSAEPVVGGVQYTSAYLLIN